MNKNKIQLTVASIVLATLVGCAGLTDARYEGTQKARAVREYIQCGNAQCEKFPHDYKLGWIDGFYNIATGGPSCPPAVAPSRYWNPKQILDDCDNRRHAYYSGWQDGAARASAFPDTHHLKLFETCECSVPRCESACGGACGPCGGNAIGLPVHQDLIETSYPTESIIPAPIVPPAPVSDDEEEETDEEEEEGEDAEKAKDSDDKAADTLELPESDGVSTFNAGQSGNPVQTELEMLETDVLDESPAKAVVEKALVQQHDATSIFGKAFDAMHDPHSTVKLQESDPVMNLEDEPVAAPLADQTTGTESVTTDSMVAQDTPTLVLPQPNITPVKEGQGTVRHVEEIMIPQSPSVTQKVTEEQKSSESLTAAKVSVETIPVRFEMIESDQPAVVLAQ